MMIMAVDGDGDFRCYGCDRRFPARMASTDIKNGSAYCAHCEDYDYNSSDPGDDDGEEQ